MTTRFLHLDDDALSVAEAWCPLFRERGWTRLTDLLHSALPAEKLLRRRDEPDGWDNLRCELPAADGSAVTVFGKRFRKENTSRHAEREATAVLRCQEANVPVMEVIAFGTLPHAIEHCTCKSSAAAVDIKQPQFGGILLSRQIGTGRSACEMLRELAQRSDPTVQLQMQRTLTCVAQSLVRLHAAGLYHNDCQLDHFFLEDGEAKLIDLQGMKYDLDDSAAQQRWIKDLALVRMSLFRLNLHRRLGDFWIAEYGSAARRINSRHQLTSRAARAVGRWGDLRLAKRCWSDLAKGDWSRLLRNLRRRFGQAASHPADRLPVLDEQATAIQSGAPSTAITGARTNDSAGRPAA